MVGLTGPNASGKGEVAKFLASRGFAVHSLSDVVREAARDAGVEPTRDHLIAMGVRLRQTGGPGVLAERILPRLTGPAVVDSIRGPAEVATLRGLPRFVLLGIDAPVEIRFERARRRGRSGDGDTLEEFSRKEERENSTRDTGQQLKATLALSERVVCNDGSLGELHARTRTALMELGVALETADPDQ